MATTIINVIEVVNTSRQPVFIGVAPKVDSPLFTKSGQIQVLPKAKLEVEDNRFNISQLISMQNNKVIQFTRLKRAVTISEDTSTGSTGS